MSTRVILETSLSTRTASRPCRSMIMVDGNGARREFAGERQQHLPSGIVDAGIGDLEAPNEGLGRRRIVVLAGNANELGDVFGLDTRCL